MFSACQPLAGPLVPQSFSEAVRLSATSTSELREKASGPTTQHHTLSQRVAFGVCLEYRRRVRGQRLLSALYYGRRFLLSFGFTTGLKPLHVFRLVLKSDGHF